MFKYSCDKLYEKNPCSICFVGINISRFLFLYSSLVPALLSASYNIMIGDENIIACRGFYYFGTISIYLTPSYVILASIDRVLVTSQNATTRQ